MVQRANIAYTCLKRIILNNLLGIDIDSLFNEAKETGDFLPTENRVAMETKISTQMHYPFRLLSILKPGCYGYQPLYLPFSLSFFSRLMSLL
jgi:hypothetical protein